MPSITVKNLCKSFQVAIKEPGLAGAFRSLISKKYKTVNAVKDISFEIARGELVGFLGPNGAGKTTTLKLLSGLLYPTSGEMRVMGHVPWKREMDFRMRFSMVMGQRTQLWWDLPARETFALNQKIYEIPEAEFKKRQEEIVDLLDLKELIDIPVKKLSLGERMKSEVACAILHQPEVLLLDEPTLGLDLVMQKKLRRFILDYNARTSSTILLTSHNMDDVEELCRRVMIIDEGQLLYDGDLKKIVEKYSPDKLISFTSSKTIDPEDLKKFGKPVKESGASMKIEIPRSEVSAAIQKLLAQIPVVDLSIEELPIEEIIRRVFLKTPAPNDPARPEEPEEMTEKQKVTVPQEIPRPLQP